MLVPAMTDDFTPQFFHINDMPDDIRARILKRSQETIETVTDKVRPIIADVQARGDAALIDYAARFDGATLTNLRVTEAEFAAAEALIPAALKSALQHCIRNVRSFHAAQMDRVEGTWMVEVEPGVFAGEKVTPIDSVALYVPRGKNAFPSALYMLAIPAVLAGVRDIIVLTPPTPDGSVDPACLYAARICGITRVYKVGGAQAVAAAAYGTDTIPKCVKICGPGSSYVAAAKMLLSSTIDAGMPAGPSEAIIIADDTADPHNTVLDLLNEAEHGPDSAGILLTPSATLAQYVRDSLPAAIAALPEKQAAWLREVFSTFGAIIQTDDMQKAIDFANDYAPEHLLLKVADTDSVLPHLTNAGEILIGEHTVFTFGNFGIGINHVLPTGGWANTYSCTTVWDFLKRTSLSRVTREGFASISGICAEIAEYEGFPAHKRAITDRKI